MNARLNRCLVAAAALVLMAPHGLAAHEGHAGDHGFLFGALQPLLSLDHLLAGLLIAGLGAIVFAVAGRLRAVAPRMRRP